MDVQSLPAYLIAQPSLARTIDKRKAEEIAESIREIGLLSPLIVVPGKRIRNGTQVDGWDILAGNHRFEAMFRILNWKEIPCVVADAEGLRAELFTIDENLIRRELSDAERAYQTARRKEIYEVLHPETKHGAIGNGREKSRQIGDLKSERFTASTSKATGRSERAVQREAARGEKLGPTLNRIIGTSLDRGIEIDALASLPADERETLVARAEKGERVSARKPTDVAPNVVPLDTDKMHSVTVARRLMKDYLSQSYKDQCEFDALHAEHLRDHPEVSPGSRG